MTIEREKVKIKINALLAKTVSSGCTQAEALQAAEKAAELMEVYEIEATELDIKDTTCVKVVVKQKKYGNARLTGFIVGIAELCGCRCWTSNYSNEVTFFGFPQDTEIAEFLYETISTAILNELQTYKSSPEYAAEKANGYHGRSLTASFLNGIKGRIYDRLVQLAKAKAANIETAKAAKGSTGRSLVLIKSDKVEEDFSDLGIKLTTTRSFSTVRSHGARAAGSKAGDRIHLGTAVGSQTRGLLV